MKTRILPACAALALLGACAAQPDTIAPAHVSAAPWQSMPCDTLRHEARANAVALAIAEDAQRKQADVDGAMVAVSALIFWPAALFVGGADRSGEIAQLRGTAGAIRAAADARGCPL